VVRRDQGGTGLRSWTLARIVAVTTIGLALIGPLITLVSAEFASGCRSGNPLANVWGPSRLKVLSRATR